MGSFGGIEARHYPVAVLTSAAQTARRIRGRGGDELARRVVQNLASQVIVGYRPVAAR